MTDVVKFLVQLGEKQPQLRPSLRPILDHLTGNVKKDWYHAGVEEPPTSPQVSRPDPNPEQPPKVPKEDSSFFTTSPHSMRAFNTVILPQIQAKLDAADFDDLNNMMEEMQNLGRSQNVDLESSLIVFKPITMSEKKFYAEIQEVFYNWIRPKLKLQSHSEVPGSNQPQSSGGEGAKNFNFVFK